MEPRSSIKNVSDRRFANAENRRKVFDFNPSRPHFPDSPDLFGIEFCLEVFLSHHRPASSLFGHVAHVVGVSTEEKMHRIYAGWIVALVKHIKIIWNISECKRIGNPVGESVFAAITERPVAKLEFPRLPFDASCRLGNSDPVPKCFKIFFRSVFCKTSLGAEFGRATKRMKSISAKFTKNGNVGISLSGHSDLLNQIGKGIDIANTLSIPDHYTIERSDMKVGDAPEFQGEHLDDVTGAALEAFGNG